MTMAAASTAAMNSAMNYPQFQMASQPQQQPQQVAPLQIQPPSNEHFLNGEAAMSPSRSVFFFITKSQEISERKLWCFDSQQNQENFPNFCNSI